MITIGLSYYNLLLRPSLDMLTFQIHAYILQCELFILPGTTIGWLCMCIRWHITGALTITPCLLFQLLAI